MKKIVIVAVIVVGALAGVALYTGMFNGEPAAQAADEAGAAAGAGGGNRRGGDGGGFQGGGGGFGGGFPGGGGRFGRGRGASALGVGPVARMSICARSIVVGML